MAIFYRENAFFMFTLAIIGATGAVGREFISILEKTSFTGRLLFFSRQEDRIVFRGKEYPIKVLCENNLPKCDLAIFCTEEGVSRKYIPLFRSSHIDVIDLSSAYRLDPQVPLIIPEINSRLLDGHQGLIASPNCVVTLMLLAVAPMVDELDVEKIIVTTYQSASGAGEKAMQSLLEESLEFFKTGKRQPGFFPHPYAFNLFLHDSQREGETYNSEELKIIQETRKILSKPNLIVSPTCVRVPVLRAHSLSIHLTCKRKVDITQATNILKKSAGIQYQPSQAVTPLEVSGKEKVLCGRLRTDFCDPYSLEMWVIGDQLLKGAALNAWQIAQHCIKASLVSR